jgi:hypothetical protein
VIDPAIRSPLLHVGAALRRLKPPIVAEELFVVLEDISGGVSLGCRSMSPQCASHCDVLQVRARMKSPLRQRIRKDWTGESKNTDESFSDSKRCLTGLAEFENVTIAGDSQI